MIIFTELQTGKNRPLSRSKNSLFQNEAKCTTFLVEMSFICVRMTNHFHIQDCALHFVLIQKPGGTRKWPMKFCCLWLISPVYLGVRTCELFLVSQPCFSGFYIVLTSVFSLFYGTCGFNRILHRPGWAHSATSYFFLEYLSSDRSSVFMFGYGWKKNWTFCRREILSNFWLFIYLQIRRTVLFMFISILCIDVHPYQYTHCFSLSPEAEFKALHWLFRLLSLTGYKGPYKWLNPRCLLDSTPTEYWSNEFF